MRWRVISLWQPWASLWLVRDYLQRRVKLHETRGWRYPADLEGERIAVHASATMTGYVQMSKELEEICDDLFGPHFGLELPRGGVIGSIELRGCFATSDLAGSIKADDAVCGNWESGRYAWLGEDPDLLSAPIPLKGRQKFFYWDAPADLKAAA